MKIGPLVPKKIFKAHIHVLSSTHLAVCLPMFRSQAAIVFTLYGHGGHLGNVTWTIYINFRFPFPRRLHMKLGFDWPSGFREEAL